LLLLIFGVTLLHSQTEKKEEEMSNEEKYTEQECHKRFAVKLNNLTWELLMKKDRTEDDDQTMIHAAHASLYHWSLVGTEINLQRGEWMVSHVYAVLNRPEPALYHAKRCLAITEKHRFVDFDLAYAYEAMARAQACAGNADEAKKYIKLAAEAGVKIKEEEDKKIFMGDFAAEPWYGMKN
jgi:hypothetical protein